jgi:precorrin-8X/cobalt-precorrin-8 methylmutase
VTPEGEEIERKSFDMIEARLDFPYPEKRVAIRVVHATADYALADLLVFKDRPVEEGIKAIRGGRDVITDVNMVKAGIFRKVEEYGGQIRCFITDKDTIDYAVKQGITRARAAFRLHRDILEGSIVVVGNSPTALLELSALMRQGLKPALVVAAPVGFVKAKESKEEVLGLPVPCIAVRGERGGTPVAVAVVNALIRLAEENEENGT